MDEIFSLKQKITELEAYNITIIDEIFSLKQKITELEAHITIIESDSKSNNNYKYNVDLYNKKYKSRCGVDNLDYKFLQKLIYKELLLKKQLDIDEKIISNIFEHIDVGHSKKLNWHLRGYSNAYLTNYGNILTCHSLFGEHPKINNRYIEKKLVYNKKLPELIIKKLILKKWDCNHPCKLKNRLLLILKDYGL